MPGCARNERRPAAHEKNGLGRKYEALIPQTGAMSRSHIYRTSTRRRTLGALLAIGAFSCATNACSHAGESEDDNQAIASGDSVSDAGSAALPADAGELDCKQADFEPCNCATGGVGRRVCRQNTWSACESCPMPRTSKCVAGHYSGQMTASYVPTPAGFCGLITLFGGEGTATIEFDLEASGELFTVVGASCIQLSVIASDGGVPDETASMAAQKMELRGQVDCDTGEFKGEVRGTYSAVSLCDLGLERQSYFFKGPVTARFDPETRSFMAGRVVLREPPVLLPLAGEAGGEGEWSATLNPDAGSRPDRKDCLDGVRFPDELFPSSGDAGI
jgi:hypothetical protein